MFINSVCILQEKAPIEVSAALKLLSGGKSFSYPLVRKYAVEVLESANDSELLILLLQLVQALRYEPNLEGVVATSGASPWNAALINTITSAATATTTTSSSPVAKTDSSKLDANREDELSSDVKSLAQASLGLSSSQLYANSDVSSRLSAIHATSATVRNPEDVLKEQKFWIKAILDSSPLAAFLIRRACSSYAGRHLCMYCRIFTWSLHHIPVYVHVLYMYSRQLPVLVPEG
jgi:hypothetical protein